MLFVENTSKPSTGHTSVQGISLWLIKFTREPPSQNIKLPLYVHPPETIETRHLNLDNFILPLLLLCANHLIPF